MLAASCQNMQNSKHNKQQMHIGKGTKQVYCGNANVNFKKVQDQNTPFNIL